MHRPIRISILAAASALLLGACGRGDDADTTADADTATTAAPGQVAPPATDAGTLRVTEVELGRSMRGDTAVADETDDFTPRDTIHAIVRHEGAATGARITARWTFEDGQVVDERTETVSPSGAGAAFTHFMVSKASPWPAGKYTLRILVNGTEVETEEFEVK
jgi:hypothetical protein